MNEAQVIELMIPAESRFVAQARHFIAEAAAQAGWLDEDRIDDLRLVVSETVTNALLAQRRVNHAATIAVRCAIHTDRFEFSVADSAGGFERPEQLDVHADESLHREGGYGLALIEALSDEAHFVNVDGGTTVRLVVYRRDVNGNVVHHLRHDARTANA